ncbi:MAG: hypothetical protein PUE85_00400 [Firmicutes bacterium]|nr:hypothetical protein [Bacillota bacterium]
MKKKWLSLILAALMMLSVFLTGCQEEETSKEIDTDERTRPMTITLYGMTNKSTTPEAIELVQDAMNIYTEGQFNTHIILRLYPEEDYFETILKKLEEIEKRIEREEEEAKEARRIARELKKQGITTEEETTIGETEAETYYDRYGIKKTVYPEEKGEQLDIFMVNGFDNLFKLDDLGYIVPLNSQLSGNSKILKHYINPTFLETASSMGSVLGIPNNTVVGEYSYLLINKELAEKYYYNASDINTFAKAYEFAKDMKTVEPNYIPMYNIPEELTVNYMNFSLIGAAVNRSMGAYTNALPRLFTDLAAYRTYRQTLYDVQKSNFAVEGDLRNLPEDKDFAVAYIKGGPDLAEKYSDEYEVVVYRKPYVSPEEAPGTCFCVSSFAADPDRCMEVIAALTTSASFRNTFQYGVEGVHYNIDDQTGLVNIISDEYSMDYRNTGNMFILKPNSSMSEEMLKYAENDWAYAKQQNLDMQCSPYIFFDLNYITEDNWVKEATIDWVKDENGNKISPTEYPYTYTAEIISDLEKVCDEYKKKIDTFEEYTDENGNLVTISDYIRQLNTEIKDLDEYKKFVDQKTNLDSVWSQYNEWFAEYGQVPASE